MAGVNWSDDDEVFAFFNDSDSETDEFEGFTEDDIQLRYGNIIADIPIDEQKHFQLYLFTSFHLSTHLYR